MSCEICGRSSCSRSFHSLAAQESFDSQPKDLNAANERIAELEAQLKYTEQHAAELEAEVMEFKSRGNVAMSSWDEERERALREGERVVALEAEVARLREAMDKYSEDEMLLNTIERSTCLWTEMDADTNNWDTSCGTAWTIVDGTPTSNEIKYCHGCGLLIKVADKPLHGADGRLIQRR